MYLFEYHNVELCVLIDKIMVVAKDDKATVNIAFVGTTSANQFIFDTQEEADNVYIELVQAIQDFYAK